MNAPVGIGIEKLDLIATSFQVQGIWKKANALLRFVAIAAMGLSGRLSAGAIPGPHGASEARGPCGFVGLTDFSAFKKSSDAALPATVLTSPEIEAPIAWDELVVSWNLSDRDVGLKVEARAIAPGRVTKWFTLGWWSADNTRHPRESVNGQRDAEGDVKTDTLVLSRPGARVQLRLTLSGTEAGSPLPLKFLGLSFCDSRGTAPPLPPHRAAWGKSLSVPERSQLDYGGGRDWCSPTSVSMVLAYWAKELNRPELDCDVPEVAAGVLDPNWPGTGNWPFNTAFAGRFSGLRAYVIRLSGVSELEDWIVAGVPVIVSVSPGLLNGKPELPDTGHLVVCVGFTNEGDVVVNDPWARRENGQLVRRIYPRNHLVVAWKRSHNTAYVIYPTTAKIPKDRFGHWEKR
ncbi:MAG: peptidase C39 family protein [Limisphaerales bacterium]